MIFTSTHYRSRETAVLYAVHRGFYDISCYDFIILRHNVLEIITHLGSNLIADMEQLPYIPVIV